MPSINLLPKDLLPDPSILKLSKLLKSLVTIGLTLFVIVAALATAYFIFNSVSLKSSQQNQAKLETSIKSLQETEQGLFLVKDRLGKVKEVYGKPSVSKEVNGLSSILSTVPPEATLTEAVLGKGTTDTTFMVKNSTLLTQLMAGIITKTEYTRIDLLSFSFNPTLGYIVSLGFASK